MKNAAKQILLPLYKKQKSSIQNRLEEFSSLNKKQHYKEFLFCLLTPQSNAKKCWEAVEQLSKLKNLSLNQITQILKTKTRFHNTKAKRIIHAPKTWAQIKPILSNTNKKELRSQISKSVNGYGLKEASHFLRNIGKSDNKIAILDRHILKNLKSLKIIDTDKIKSQKHYLEIEQNFIDFSHKINIPIDELDLLFWSKENGKIFK